MSLTFVVHDAVPLVHIYGSGALTAEDLRRTMADLTRANAISFPRLVDLRAATLHIPAAQMRHYVAFKAQHLKERPAVRVAAIAGDLVTYGMLRMYQTLISDHDPEYGVFRTLHDAIDWLSMAQEASREVAA